MQEYIDFSVSGFSTIFFVSFIVWMIALVVLMFREMFLPGELVVREYVNKVWRMSFLSFEFVAYCSVVLALITMMWTQEYVEYGIAAMCAIVLSSIYLYIRMRTIGFRIRKKKDRARLNKRG